MTQQSIKTEQLLGIANNLLYNRFFKDNRNKAKHLFNDIDKGKSVDLTTLESTKGDQLTCQLALDKSEFIGRLSFALFRAALSVLVNNTAQKLQQKEEVRVFSNEETGSILFAVTGACEHAGQVNVLMLGAEQSQAGAILFKLQFVDPSQFTELEQAEPATAESEQE